MAALPVGKNDHSRLLLADNLRHLKPVFPVVLDSAVRNVESIAPGNAKNSGGGGSLFRAFFRGAASAKFSTGKIQDSGTMAELRHLEQCSAASLLNVVTMSGNSWNVD